VSTMVTGDGRSPSAALVFGKRKQMMKNLNQRLKSKNGQTLVEYALILAFISVVAIAVLISLGTQIKGTFTKITSALASAQSSH
jgi:Flp pilus assembly pilin Flp